MYKAQHIPGAINVDLFSYGAQELPVSEMEQRFQSFGISRGKRILIYDQGGSFMATKLFYDLYYYGFPARDLLVLDGGLSKWRAAGGSVTKNPTPAPQKGSFRITTVNEYARVKLPEFLTASGDPRNNALVEALEPAGTLERPLSLTAPDISRTASCCPAPISITQTRLSSPLTKSRGC